MNGTIRKRLRAAAIIVSAIPLALAVVNAPSATAAPTPAPAPAPASAPVSNVVHMTTVFVPSTAAGPTAVATTSTYVGDTIGYVVAHYTGFRVGPNRRTGYGQAIISSFTKATCYGCTWYKANLSITNHQPFSPVMSPASGPMKPRTGAVAASSYCWPWQGDSIHCSLWYQASSWDWNNILGDLNFNPLNTSSTKDKIYACYRGVYQGIAMRGTGSLVGTIIDGMEKIVHLNAAGFAWASIGTCTMQMVRLQ